MTAPAPPSGGWRPSRRAVRWGLGVLLTIAAIVVFLALFNWDWLRGPIARYASARTGRDVRIEGHLKVHLFSWTPQATVGGLKIGNPKWLGKGDTVQIQAITAKVKLLPLFVGRTELPLLRLDRPDLVLIKDMQGRESWQFKKSNKPSKLPPIQNFIINDGHIHFADQKRRMMIDGTIQSHENIQNGSGAAFELAGRGSINDRPFLMRVTGGPLINVHKDRPYNFNADVRAGATHITAAGAFPKPFDFGLINARISGAGPDMADLFFLTGVALPNTPAYHLSADFSRKSQLYSFHGINGRIGGSDMAGSLSVDGSTGRPELQANLVSRLLVFDDLNALFGGPRAGAKGKIAPAGRKVVVSGGNRLWSNAPLDLQRIRTMDADVRYRATSIHGASLPIRALNLHLTLDHGVLAANPLSLQLPQGQIAGSIRLDARAAIPVTDLDMRLSNARIEHFLTPVKGSIPMVGSILGRAKLRGSGNSIFKAVSSSAGSVTLVSPNGEIRKAFAELLGINVLPGFLELLQKNQDRTQLRCAVGHFGVSGGVMRAQQLTFDTDVVRVDGQGTINLVDEGLNLKLNGKPKKIRILHINAPIDINGDIGHPRMHVEAGKALAQGGIGVALAALVSPVALILPFVDPGLAKNADCSALLTQARQGPAAVPAAHPTRRSGR